MEMKRRPYQCSQSRNTIAALQPVPQYHCSIASNQAITPEIAKTHSKPHIFTPIAALLAIVQYQCNIACIPATPMQALHAIMQSQCNQPCTPSAAVYALQHSTVLIECFSVCTHALPVQQCMHHRGKIHIYYYN